MIYSGPSPGPWWSNVFLVYHVVLSDILLMQLSSTYCPFHVSFISNVLLMSHVSAYLYTVLFMCTSRVSLPIYLMSTSCMSISCPPHVSCLSISYPSHVSYQSILRPFHLSGCLSMFFLLYLAVYLTSFSCVMSVYIMSCPVLCFLPSFLLISMSCPSI